MHSPAPRLAAPSASSLVASPVTAAGPSHAGTGDELTDDDLEQVVGGLARTWTDALRGARRPA